MRSGVSDSSQVTCRVLALGVFLAAVPNQVYVLLPSNFSASSSLPVELCDLAWMTAIWALWTRTADFRRH